ncbi:alpha/beta hydrolase [Pengzhenrongella phosphoraccumulans]|uniref:alpha/beta hydrolase n=1 Tax=Pengzhenrongella phosphoraccumulans TaxID=3114394 RepID=UPI00389065DD
MSGVTEFLLRIEVLTPGVLITAFVIGGIVVALLLARRVPGWPIRAVVAVVAGAAIGALVLWVVEKWVNLLGTPLMWSARWWVIAFFAAVGLAVANASHSTWRRKVGALFGVVVLLLTTSLGINAAYGLDPTVGSVLGISTQPQIPLPPLTTAASLPAATPGASSALWQTWTAPAGMPAKGTVGSAVIPNTVSGFVARPAGIYLPPAALTAHPPRLPLVVLMMGQPGNPETQYIAATLDSYAAAHHGLAPIVIVADQLGRPTNDTLCLDTAKFGKVETYVNTDVVTWARTHLNILTDRASWTVAGYSHGGQCAISFAAKHPDLWGNVLDISGEEFPGAEHAAKTLSQIFGGKQSAYDAQKPIVVLAHHTYPDTTAIFTASVDDPVYVAAAKKVSAAAQAAGMRATYVELPSGGHTVDTLRGDSTRGSRPCTPDSG